MPLCYAICRYYIDYAAAADLMFSPLDAALIVADATPPPFRADTPYALRDI